MLPPVSAHDIGYTWVSRSVTLILSLELTKLTIENFLLINYFRLPRKLDQRRITLQHTSSTCESTECEKNTKGQK